MPTFPTYHGELPKCLNPLNPRHYMLLAYWIFFRPTVLKSYLYQSDPKRYQEKMGLNILHTWNAPAYRNLYVMMSVVSVLCSLLIDFPFTLLLSWNKSIPIDWLLWLTGSVAGAITGAGFGLGFGMILCLKNYLAAGVAFSGVLGVFGAMATSVWMGATAGIAQTVVAEGAIDITLSLTIALVFGGGAAAIACMASTSAFNWKVGVLVGLFSGIVAGAGIAGVLGIGARFGVEQGFGTAFGVIGGVIGNVLIGMALCSVSSIRGNPVLGMLSSFLFGIISGIAVDLATGLSFCIGVLRLIFYPFQFLLALCRDFCKLKHPLEWDELITFPLPGTCKILNQKLRQDEKKGLHFLADIGRNPFQRASMQKVLYRYIHKHAAPVRFFYTLFTDSIFDEYVLNPTKPDHLGSNIAVSRLFLGEIALRIVTPRQGIYSPSVEKLAWWFTYPLREHNHTPLTRFAAMLCDLSDRKTVEAEKFELASYADTYKNFVKSSDGLEIAQTFNAMALYLSYVDLSDLANAVDTSVSLSFDDPIRPTVLTALNRLGEVGAEVKTYQDSSSRTNQMAALARAADALKDLDKYVQEEVMAPEQYILRRIIRQWQALLITAGGELGRAEEVGPVANPYVAGNPVTGELFVGRKDILRRLEELWSGDGQKPSIVLYGHRRMGKTSILHNLGTRFGKNTEIVDFNMQRAGLVFSTGELLYNLALAMYDALEASFQSQADSESFGLAEPEEEPFMAHNPYTAFDRFLKQIDRIRGEKRFIITIDEFEMIEQKIHKGNLEALLLDFCRGLIQTYPWFIVAFAGLHTLQEMTHDYWNPLFGSVTGVPVSFLKKKAVEQLIMQPSSDFSLDYDRDAIDEIGRLTNGQSYLVQLICHNLVSLFNRQSFEEGIERERRFSLADVEAVIHAPEFFRDGEAYFSGVWQQAQGSETAAQHDILLKLLAQTESGMSIGGLVEQSGLIPEKVQNALNFLQRHDVVKKCDDGWSFTVELMRRWVEQRE